jgi:starch-binding outer membrane protein, SusD/RagB family
MRATDSTRKGPRLAMLGLLLALSGTGCDGLTDVRATDVITADALGNAAGATTLYAGAVSTFTMAFAGHPVGFQVASGLIADEFVTAPPTGSWTPFDFRVFPDPGPASPYNELHQARIAALQAIEGLQANAPEPQSRIGEMYALVGYTQIFFGEMYCSGVPISALVNNEPEFGTQLTTTQMFEQAVGDFDLALANAGTSDQVRNLARVGRARALLNLGRFPEAAASVTEVPTGFRYEVKPDGLTPPYGENGYYWCWARKYLSVVDREGGNGLPFISANDPRVPLQLGAGLAYGYPWYQVPRYMTATAPVELASGIEARLIQAEAAYRANPNDASPAGSGWLGVLNQLRATAVTPPLPALGDPGSPEARVDLLFHERAFWTFATGRRQGDMRRLVRQYGRFVDSVFPVGVHYPHRSMTYGDGVNLAPPERQFNNPNYTGCLNRDP